MSDPRLSRSPAGIAADIELRRSYPGYSLVTFLIVEGDSDVRFFEKPGLVDLSKCEIIPAQGKEPAKRALSELEKRDFPGVLCILDSDFERMVGIIPSSSNLLYTDTHDLETMLLQSPALEKVLSELGVSEKYIGKNVRDTITKAALPIGYLRFHSEQKQIFLRFERMNFSLFLNENTLNINIGQLLQHIKDKSPQTSFDVALLENEIDQSQKTTYDVWQLCSGHDLTAIFAVSLRKMFGNIEKKPKDVESSLRIAYEDRYFFQTNLYRSIKQWEEANKPYIVLVKSTP